MCTAMRNGGKMRRRVRAGCLYLRALLWPVVMFLAFSRTTSSAHGSHSDDYGCFCCAPRARSWSLRHAKRSTGATRCTRPGASCEMAAMETAVQIAIPAEAMFPPGAMPMGMNFIAELSIARTDR